MSNFYGTRIRVITAEEIKREQDKHAHRKVKSMTNRLKFPNVSGRDERITEIRTRMADLYDEAAAAKKRNAAMAAEPIDPEGRFPVLNPAGGES